MSGSFEEVRGMEERIKQNEQRKAVIEMKVAAGTTTNIGVTGKRIDSKEFTRILKEAQVIPVSKAVAEEII